MKCPRCSKTTVRRSHRRGIDRILSLFKIFPFRCDNCTKRFRRMDRSTGNAPGPVLVRSLKKVA